MLLVVGLLAEGVARWFAPQVPTWRGGDTGVVIMVGHPTRLWGLAEGVRENESTTATVSKLGLRGPVPKVPRPKGRQRLLLLGDSTFFGHGVPDEKTMAAQLESRLQSGGVDAEVVNGGIPGYSTEQTKLLLEEVGWGLEPTLLLLGSLWSDNNFDHFPDADLLRTRAAFNDNPFARSSFFQILAGVFDRMKGGRGARIVTWTRTSEWPEGGTRRVPLQQYASNLDRMVRDAKARGIGALFISPCNDEQTRGTVGEGAASWQPYFDAQAAVAAWHRLPLAAVCPAMIADAAVNGADGFFLDQMHPTNRGHGVIAALLARTLADAGWPAVSLLGRDEAFDASSLVDPGGNGRSEVMNPLSPQANLFTEGGSATPTPPGTEGGLNGLTTAPANPGRDGSGWILSGEITGGSAPITVEARSTAGAALASATLAEPGTFSMRIRADTPEVEVVVTGADGKAVTERASKDGRALEIGL
jgi:lysophospholipase L1-like esterase